MVAMETSKLMDKEGWRQNVPSLGKVTKFGGYSFNGLEVTNIQSWRGLQKPPHPPVWIGLTRRWLNILLLAATPGADESQPSSKQLSTVASLN